MPGQSFQMVDVVSCSHLRRRRRELESGEPDLSTRRDRYLEKLKWSSADTVRISSYIQPFERY